MTISRDRTQEKIDELLETFTKADKESQARLFEEINTELEAFLSSGNNDNYSTEVYLIS